MLWAYIVGYGFSIFAGLLIGHVTDAMRGGVSGETGRGWQMRMQGSVEQVLYTSSVIINQPLLIAAWLGVKTAAQWHDWVQRKDPTHLFDKYLSPYLVGNALSIYHCCHWCQGDWMVGCRPLFLVVGSRRCRIWNPFPVVLGFISGQKSGPLMGSRLRHLTAGRILFLRINFQQQ